MNILEGSVRSSKTTCADLAWIKFVSKIIQSGESDDSPLLMVGKTERTLKRNVIDPLIGMLGHSRCRYNAGTGELHLLGKTIYTAGANDERAATRIAGMTLRGAYVDELSLIPETFFKMLMSRLSLDDARLIATSNPDSSNHWALTKYLRKASRYVRSGEEQRVRSDESQVDLNRFGFRLRDNPHLPPRYVKALAKEYTGLWKLRYIDGEWVIAEGAVYPMYGDHLIVKHPRSGNLIVIGIDYGTTNAFAAIAIEITSARIHVFSELSIEDPLTDGELSRSLSLWLSENQISPKWICVDPSAASFKRQLFRDRIYNVVDADNEVLDGIRMVASLLSEGLLTIDPSCETLQDEFPNYRWDDKASLEGIDKPIKTADHRLDALRYAVSTTENLWRQAFNLHEAS